MPTNELRRLPNGSKLISGASKVLESTVRNLKVVNRAHGLAVRTTVTQTCIADGPGFESQQVHLATALPAHLAH